MSSFVKQHTLPIIACFAAVISAFFVPPSAAYLDYFDFKTLGCLFCISATVNALVSTGLFARLAKSIVSTLKTQRTCVIAMVLITLVGAMFITNDMALLTFLPLSYLVLSGITDDRRLLAWCFILQNAAAVLGGMILPFGNPHNLYLYSLFDIPTGTFILTMLPTFITAVVLIGACCLFVKPIPLAPLEAPHEGGSHIGTAGFCRVPRKAQLGLYCVLFVLTLCAILRVIPFLAVLALVIVCLLIVNPRILARVDYGLLITFAAFFVFAGNLSSIPQVREFLMSLLEQNALITIVGTCQIISNLPTTLLYAPFTTDWATLLVATDIAGMGTPIASLASLITIKSFLNFRRNDAGLFMRLFLAVGFSFLIVLCIVAAVFL
ncbi:MAG: SLC13 family permease [Eggerthellaceae bacterium]|nr:SLC13 family permease [Eggerthellaceae bacterium]